MSANQSFSDSERPYQWLEPIVEEDSKQSFRNQVWEHLEKNKLVYFPRPVFGRIPNFKGTEKAAVRLLDLEEFQVAKTVEIDPDKALEASRMVVINKNKILYVPVPNLQAGLLKKLSFCTDDKPKNIKQAVTRWGINTLGKAVDFGEDLHIDLIVLGSVAVSKEGRRIGKGRGFADLEYAILKEMKAVDDNTIIVTTVHDCQVFDSLPDDIFQNYDVPVDYILTPTETIKVEKKLPRPEGIYWDVLSQRKLDLIPILQQIKGGYQGEVQENTVVENEDDKGASGEKQDRGTNLKPRLFERKRISNYAENPRKQRFFRRSRSANLKIENADRGNKENSDFIPFMKNRPRPFRRNARRYKVNFSLVVSNIDKNVRVRQLKDVLIDHGIRPSNITWRGCKGFCYLHYVKSVKNEEKAKSSAIDNVVATLKTLKLNPDSSNLRVKIMEPKRIETTRGTGTAV